MSELYTSSPFGSKPSPVKRGDSDTDITYIALYNSDGEKCYIYPNATQDGITVSGTKP